MTTLPLPLRLPRDAASGRSAGRSLTGYLLVPRPKDLVKALVLPLAFAVGAATSGGATADQLWRAALVWAVLELLVYQARYQWNDIRGFAADQAHPDAASRGRLPGPVEKGAAHIGASLGVMGLRLGLTLLVALVVPELAVLLLAMTLGVFGVAAVYERLRSAATGRTGQVPVPLRPALLGLWVVVGAGYAVRGLTGLALAVDLGGRPALAGAAAVSMWALGVVFVTCRWLLEAMDFASVRDGRLVWQVRADQAREHTVGLARWLPEGAVPVDGGPCSWRPLQGRTPLTAPWHLALVAAAAGAAVMGRLLAGGDMRGAVPVLLLGAVAALAVAALPGRRLLVTLAGAVAVAAVQPEPVAVVPWLVVLASYGCFTHQCADEIGKPLHRLQPLLHR